jgi:RNA polymerase sigma-70 factor (ECF subfamily)
VSDGAAKQQALAARIATEHGRAEVVRELFVAHRRRVFALCLHITGRRAEAEDALQEAFLAVHRALAEFRGESSLSTWLYRIAIRTAFAARARRKPARPLPDDLTDASPGPDRLAGARLEAARLLAAFDALNADQRTILSMFAVEGLRHGEIAEVLGIPEGTVWSRLHAARRALARATGDCASPTRVAR